ncbi:MAG: glycosyl hydrolase [Polyangiaceae bacterium]|nr:glycosyl hydrolase [Polyangiaceae bacterium]
MHSRLVHRIASASFTAIASLTAAFTAGCFTDTGSPVASLDAGADATSTEAGVDGSPVDDAANAGTVVISTDGGTPISPTAFGNNYWDWVDWSNDGVSGLTGTESQVQLQHLNVLRAGGFNNDANTPKLFDTSRIDAFVTYCRAVGAEPILQVPLISNDVDGGAATADTAAAMVTYANVTMGYGIQYWEIGNEPDIYSMQFDAGSGLPMSPADLCTDYAAYATAMKAANAAAADGGVTMQFLGPELAYKYTSGSDDWLTPFLDACKDYVDVVSVHRYPFSAAQTSVSGALNDVTQFRDVVSSVSSIVANHARPGTPLAITEANISYDYDSTKYTAASAVAAPGTFPAALWTADVAGAALEANLWTLAFWNLGELPGTGSVLGFIVGGTPVPAYYAEQLVSANFRGNVVKPAGVPAGYSVYASHDPAGASTAVLVLNKTTTASRAGIAVDALPVQSFVFPAMSMTLVTIPDAADGGVHVTRYTGDDADAGSAPQMLQ